MFVQPLALEETDHTFYRKRPAPVRAYQKTAVPENCISEEPDQIERARKELNEGKDGEMAKQESAEEAKQSAQEIARFDSAKSELNSICYEADKQPQYKSLVSVAELVSCEKAGHSENSYDQDTYKQGKHKTSFVTHTLRIEAIGTIQIMLKARSDQYDFKGI